MNAKMAKRLRKIALGMVVTADEQKAADGKPLTPKVAYRQNREGTVQVAQNSFKGAYKALKKATSTGKIPKNAQFPQVQTRDPSPSSIHAKNVVGPAARQATLATSTAIPSGV